LRNEVERYIIYQIKSNNLSYRYAKVAELRISRRDSDKNPVGILHIDGSFKDAERLKS
jgi:hypothetical protein